MTKSTLGKTGQATIDKQGHTTSGAHGTDPNPTSHAKNKTRDLNLK